MLRPEGRISCPRCGANNFDTVSECWRCHTPLAAASLPIQAIDPPAASVAERSFVRPPVSAPPGFTGDPNLAKRAAILLALTLPFVGLPVGWIFMMIEDERRQAIGRLCAVWSLISLVLQFLLMFAFAQALAPWMTAVVSTAVRAAQPSSASGSSGGAP